MPEQISQLVAVVQADLKALNESVVRSAETVSEHSLRMQQQTEVMQNMAKSNELQTEVLKKMADAFELSVKTQLQVAQGQVPALYIPIKTHERLMKWQLTCFSIVLLAAVGVAKGGEIATFLRGL